jgi:hypothetical protein
MPHIARLSNNRILHQIQARRFWYINTETIFSPPYDFHIIFYLFYETYNGEFYDYTIPYLPYIQQILLARYSETGQRVSEVITLGQLIHFGSIGEEQSYEENESRGGSM